MPFSSTLRLAAECVSAAGVVARFAAIAAVLSVLGCRDVKAPPRASGPLGLEQARQFVLELVNHDRALEGLDPVQYDEVAERAAQRHVEDMAAHGFTAHWGTDGSVPEQRYSEAGGQHFVKENAACFFDGTTRELEGETIFMPSHLEKIQRAFMSEVAPHDGHKRNILEPWHTHLGVGLARPKGVQEPCLTQEFVDVYGEYEPIPIELSPGSTITVSGSVEEPVVFGGVGLARVDLPEAIAAEDLNQTSTYSIPESAVVYFPEGYKTPRPVQVDGNRFSIDLVLGEDGKAGRYEVSVWGKFPGDDQLLMISLRTVTVK